jgi:hypothetical protein
MKLPAAHLVQYDENILQTLPSLAERINIQVTHSIDSILPEFRDLVFKYKMNKKYGLFLLHKHFNLNIGEIYYRELLETELILQAQNESDIDKQDIVPYTFKFANDKIYVVEYIKRGDGVIEPDFENLNEIEFLSKISKLICNNNMQEIFGIQLLTKFQQTFLEPGLGYIEESDKKNPRREITKVRSTNDKRYFSKIVNTNWSYAPYSTKKEAITMGCEFFPGGYYGEGSKHTQIPDQHLKY